MNENKALISHLVNHFSMHSARIYIMVEIISSLIKVGDVQQQKIAQGTSMKTKINSITRRIQRFFAEEFLDPHMTAKLIFGFFDWEQQINFTLDRTNWKFGIFDINFLVISGIYKGCAIPLCWILLPHQGNSQTETRVNLIEMLLLIVPAGCMKFLLADREFIGREWFNYLYEKGIPFCIRIKENMLVTDTRRGGQINLKNLFQHLLIGQSRELQQCIDGVMLRIIGTKMESGELLILAVSGNENLLDALELYKQRWTIETMFKAYKSSGFNFENTHQKKLERLSKMMTLLTIAYAWAIKIGEIKNDIKPIRTKNHGRLEFSLFSYGFRAIQTVLLKGDELRVQLFALIEKISLKLPFSLEMANVTVVY